MAAMGYLPVELAGDAKILPPVNHECQPINVPRVMYDSVCKFDGERGRGEKNGFHVLTLP